MLNINLHKFHTQIAWHLSRRMSGAEGVKVDPQQMGLLLQPVSQVSVWLGHFKKIFKPKGILQMSHWFWWVEFKWNDWKKCYNKWKQVKNWTLSKLWFNVYTNIRVYFFNFNSYCSCLCTSTGIFRGVGLGWFFQVIEDPKTTRAA
jgi:hypothetical protein